jgi:hypothetical protein
MVASSNPLRRGSRGWCVFINQNHGAGGGNGSIMVVVFVSCVFQNLAAKLFLQEYPYGFGWE